MCERDCVLYGIERGEAVKEDIGGFARFIDGLKLVLGIDHADEKGPFWMPAGRAQV